MNSAFWHDVFLQTPTRIIMAASFVATVVQLIKTTAPSIISGRVAIALNLLVSLAAVFVDMNAANFWTETTLLQVIAVFAGAAGIHSTAKSLSGGSLPGTASNVKTDTPKATGPNLVQAILLCFVIVTFTGCQHAATPTNPSTLAPGAIDALDANTNQTLQTIHAFLYSVSQDVAAGKVKLSAPQLQALDTANKATNAADIAEQAYHASPGGSNAILSSTLAAAVSAFTTVQGTLAANVTK